MRRFLTVLLDLFVLLVMVWLADSASGQTAAQKKFEALQQQATSDSPDARKEAAKGLAEFGWVVVMPILEKLLDDPDPAVQREALMAMRDPIKKSGLMPLPAERGGPKSPYWDGTLFQQKIGSGMDALTTRLKKLAERDDPAVRAAVEEILHRLEIRMAATSLKLRSGHGEAREADPSKKVKVEKDDLRDAKGQTIAHLTRAHESVSCWTFSADARLVAVGIRFDSGNGRDGGGTVKGGLRLYEAQTGEQLGGAGGYFGPITHVAFAPDGKALLYEMSDIKEIGGK